jgi:hypothetical protein
MINASAMAATSILQHVDLAEKEPIEGFKNEVIWRRVQTRV